jgi:hypothetical protein
VGGKDGWLVLAVVSDEEDESGRWRLRVGRGRGDGDRDEGKCTWAISPTRTSRCDSKYDFSAVGLEDDCALVFPGPMAEGRMFVDMLGLLNWANRVGKCGCYCRCWCRCVITSRSFIVYAMHALGALGWWDGRLVGIMCLVIEYSVCP